MQGEMHAYLGVARKEYREDILKNNPIQTRNVEGVDNGQLNARHLKLRLDGQKIRRKDLHPHIAVNFLVFDFRAERH